MFKEIMKWKKLQKRLNYAFQLDEFFGSLDIDHDSNFDFDIIACYLAVNVKSGYLTKEMLDHLPKLVLQVHKAFESLEEEGINYNE